MPATMISPPNQSAAAPQPKRSGGIFVPHPPRWYQRLLAWFIFALIRSVAATLRYRWLDRSQQFDGPPPGPVIYCTWHNRLVLCATAYYKFAQKRNPTAGLAAIVSASKDGGFLVAILERFRFQPVRGSSSRRGAQALLELTSWAQRGYDLAITPDGPRGPCYVVQEGVMSLAQMTGRPVIPWAFNLRWKLRLKSWDRFQIPLPFARCEMVVGKPVRVPRDATDAEREALRQNLQQTMREMTED